MIDRLRLSALALAVAAPAAAFAQSPGTVVLDPETRSFIDSLEGAPAVDSLPPEEARQLLIDTQTGAEVEMPPATIEARTLEIGPTGSVEVRIVTPEGAEGPLPAVVYFHGGGWILGNFTTHERLMRDLATQAEAAIIFVEYAPSPEAKHPVALEQDYAVLTHVAENAGDFGIDPERIALAGDSVGGQMVAVTAMWAKERGGPALDAMVMFYPVTTATLDSESYELFADGPWLTKAMMEWFWDAYLPEGADTSDPAISPLEASIEQLSGLPPALVITDANDVLRDEGEAFADKLVEAGVETEATRWKHTMHDFVMLNPIANAPAPRGAIEQAAGFLREHFEN